MKFASVKFEKNDYCEIFRNYNEVCVFVLFNRLNDHWYPASGVVIDCIDS